MKKFVLLSVLTLALCIAASAQTSFVQAGILNASGAAAQGAVFESSAATVHTITWTSVATVSACTLQLETSAGGVSFALMTGSAAQTCTSSGSYTFTGPAAAYVRVNFTTLTVSGGGSVTWTYSGQAVAVPAGTPYVSFCGATTGGAANCANTNPGTNAHVIGGSATLAANAQVVTFAPAYTSTATYTCVANDITTRANVVQAVPTTAATMTITNTTGATDVIQWVCVGY